MEGQYEMCAIRLCFESEEEINSTHRVVERHGVFNMALDFIITKEEL